MAAKAEYSATTRQIWVSINPIYLDDRSAPFLAGADRGQTTLMPECLDDFIDESNLVRAIDAFVEALDLAEQFCTKPRPVRRSAANRMLRVAGIVLIRQRPGSANGVIFSTLEDETGIANIITWPKTFERYRRTVLAARLVGVRGTLQREQGVIHVVAGELIDMSRHLASLSEKHGGADAFLSPTDHVKHGGKDPRGKPRRRKGALSEVLPKGRNFQ